MALITVLVGAASAQVIGASTQNLVRRKLTFHNPNIVGQQSIYLTQAPAAAVVGSGLALLPGEKYDVFGDQCLTAWNGIGSAAGANVSVIEYLYAAGNLPQGYLFSLPVG
ncbi:MAG TPA: hypothetical protein VGA05_08335 [Candidatus Bathyarchaeia archaeon]